jgi:tetratricopeptide (TPR) repeat protein
MGQPDGALPLLVGSLERSHPTDSIVRKLFSLVASCHWKQGQPHNALHWCLRGLQTCPDDPELLLLEGVLRAECGDLAAAELALEQLIESRSAPRFASVTEGLRTFRAREQLALVCLRQGKLGRAVGLLRQALAERPDLPSLWAALADTLLAMGRWADLAGALEGLRQAGGEADACLIEARACLARQDPDRARALVQRARELAPGHPAVERLAARLSA